MKQIITPKRLSIGIEELRETITITIEMNMASCFSI